VFNTVTGSARFTVHPIPESRLEAGEYLMMTIRSHDQFNTTVYGHDDRYRGIRGDRRVILLHEDDVRSEGLRADQRVDLTSHYRGEKRSLAGFRVVPYDVPRGCAAAYFPEVNALVPIESVADGSRTPTFKSIAISITASGPDA
jgi:anaerobic selenocysteine-containing dehydrogenase